MCGTLISASDSGIFKKCEQLQKGANEHEFKQSGYHAVASQRSFSLRAKGAEQQRNEQEDSDNLLPNKPSCSEGTNLAESRCDTHRTIVLQHRKQINQPYFKEITMSQASGKSSTRNRSGDFNHISLLHFSLPKCFHRL